jgi:hypothetical protein
MIVAAPSWLGAVKLCRRLCCIIELGNVIDHRKKQSRWQPRLASAMLACGLLLAKIAAAQPNLAPERTIALIVLPSEMPAIASADVRAAAAQVLAASNESVVSDAMKTSRQQWLDGVLSTAQLQSLRQIAQRVQQGWQLYLRVSLDAARVELDAAVNEAIALAWDPAALQMLADALVRRGIVAAFVATTETSKEQAYADIRLALRLHPGRLFDAAEFSPDVIAMINTQRNMQQPMQNVQLSVALPAASASAMLPIAIDRAVRIAVDGGKPVSVADQSMLQMAAGSHLLVAMSQVAAPIALLVNVSTEASSRPLLIPIENDAVASALAQGVERSMAPVVVDEVWNALRAANVVGQTLVVVASWRRSQPTLLGQRCILRTVVICTVVSDVGWSGQPNDLMSAMRSLIESVRQQQPTNHPISLVTESRVEPPKPAASRCGWCRNRWLWTGVAAATLTAAATLYVVGQQSTPAPVLIVNPADWR